MHELVYRPAALSDLDAIYDYIGSNNPRRAASYVNQIREKCRLLTKHPRLGPARDDIQQGLRIYPMFGRIVVCYRMVGDTVVVIRVFSRGRDYTAIMSGSRAD